MTVFNYIFDDRDYPGIKLTIEAEMIPGVRATLNHPSVESDVVIGSIEGDFRVYYEEDYFHQGRVAAHIECCRK